MSARRRPQRDWPPGRPASEDRSGRGAGASCGPCAANRETPQSMLPNITTATHLILGGSNFDLGHVSVSAAEWTEPHPSLRHCSVLTRPARERIAS